MDTSTNSFKTLIWQRIYKSASAEVKLSLVKLYLDCVTRFANWLVILLYTVI